MEHNEQFPHIVSLPVEEVGYKPLPQVVTTLCHLMTQPKLQAIHEGLEMSQFQGFPDLLIRVLVERV